MRARGWALVWSLMRIIVLNDEALGGIGIFDDDVDGMVLEEVCTGCESNNNVLAILQSAAGFSPLYFISSLPPQL